MNKTCHRSVVFLSSWKRQEAEHAFLWGSEGFEDAEEARPEFRGLLVVNEETGKEDLIYGAVGPRLTKKLISIGVIATCMILTVFGALTASSLKYMAPAKCNAQIDVTKSAFGCTLGEMDCCYCLDIKDCPGYNGVNGTMDRIGQVRTLHSSCRPHHSMDKLFDFPPTPTHVVAAGH
jgi:hypothetical protein